VHHAQRALPDAPPALLQAAIGLWSQPAVPALLHSALRLVKAVLSFDSWALSPQAAGMRGMTGDSRHLLFSAEGRDVDLRIARSDGGRWQVAGQVLGPDDSGHISLTPTDGGAVHHSAVLDALGEFHLDGIGAGTWRLMLDLPDQRLELPPIVVGGAGP
jgi:hypothetical protein